MLVLGPVSRFAGRFDFVGAEHPQNQVSKQTLVVDAIPVHSTQRGAMVSEPIRLVLPDHTQLPESDGTFVFAKRLPWSQNFQEHPQSILLTDSIQPRLQDIHPDGQYCIGQDCGIYWRMTDPPERGAAAPDWFYVANVPPTLNGQLRRSYVLWQELIAPLIVLEFVSGDGEAERDTTPYEGKFWIYERVIRLAFYGIYEVSKASVELYQFVAEHYQPAPVNLQRLLLR